VRPNCRRHQAAIFAPCEKPVACSGVSAARVWVADVRGEKFDVAPRGFVAQIGDQRRHDVQRPLVGGDFGLLDRRR